MSEAITITKRKINDVIRIEVESTYFPEPKENELTKLFKSFNSIYNGKNTRT